MCIYTLCRVGIIILAKWLLGCITTTWLYIKSPKDFKLLRPKLKLFIFATPFHMILNQMDVLAEHYNS